MPDRSNPRNRQPAQPIRATKVGLAHRLVHAWAQGPYGNGVLDLAGNANGVFGVGTGVTTGNYWRVGPGGYHLLFDDSGTGMTASAVITAGTSSGNGGPGSNVFSIQARVRIVSNGAQQTIYSGDGGSVQFRILAGGAVSVLERANADIGNSSGLIAFGVDVDIGVSYDGTTATFYINGVASGTATNARTFITSQYYLGAASAVGSSERIANGGRIYYCYVWDRTRSAAEFAAIKENNWRVLATPRRRQLKVAANAGGTTAIQWDLAATYSTTGSVLSDLLASYGLASSATSDLAATFAIQNGVQQDLSASFGVISAAQQDIAASYTIQTSVQQDLAGVYAVIQAIQQDLASSYLLASSLTPVEQDLAASYTVSQTAQQDLLGAYGLAGTAQSDFTALFGVLSTAQQDQAVAYGVLTSAQRDLAALFGVVSATQQDLGGIYALISSASADIQSTYTVLNSAAADCAVAYSILISVFADRAGTYTVTGSAFNDLFALWVNGSVANDPIFATLRAWPISVEVTTPPLLVKLRSAA